jgi:hypothetical protein
MSADELSEAVEAGEELCANLRNIAGDKNSGN